MARRESYRTRLADPEAERRTPRGSSGPSSMVVALSIAGFVALLAIGALVLTKFLNEREAERVAAAEAARVQAQSGPQPFADLPEPSDEPFRKTSGSSRAAPARAAAAEVPETLRTHSDWETATRLEAEGRALLDELNALRDAGDLAWRDKGREALSRFEAALAATEPWISVLQNQYGAGDSGVKAFMKRRDDWREKCLTLNRLL